MPSDRHYLMRMNQTMGHVIQFAKAGRAEFMASMQLQHAILWNLQLVSVAARHLSAEERQMHPDVDWSHVCSLCHEVIGDPWDVSPQKVWNCVQEELPELRHQVREILIDRQHK
jgi:uncharacterized protein with HEPN domain